MEYTNIKKQIEQEQAHYFQNTTKYIMEGNEDRVKNYSTGTRWEQYKAGKITLDELKQFAVERSRKSYEKKVDMLKRRADQIGNAGTVESITIRVDWKRSSYWGWNPTATVEIYGSNGWKKAEDKASGCGYDKRSAAVGGAMGKIDELIKILCDMKEAAMEAGIGLGYNNPGSNEKYIAYGAGYGAIPYYEGGVGFSCFDNILIKAGFTPVVRDESGKHSDYYYYVRKAEKEAC